MSAAHPDALSQILDLLITWWWLSLIFGAGIYAGIYEAIQKAFAWHHERKLEVLREKAAIAAAVARVDEHHAKMALPYVPAAAVEPGAGPCKHRSDVVPVFEEATGKRLAWYCKTCETQLPATYAIGPEDL